MGNSKVVFGNETLIDLTNDTVNENNLLAGETAHGANGELITGKMITKPVYQANNTNFEEVVEQAEELSLIIHEDQNGVPYGDSSVEVIDNLVSTARGKALSANMGRELKNEIDEISSNLTNENNEPFRFGYDSVSGKRGYIIKEAGTDVFVPFKSEMQDILNDYLEKAQTADSLFRSAWNDGSTRTNSYGKLVGGANTCTFTASKDCAIVAGSAGTNVYGNISTSGQTYSITKTVGDYDLAWKNLPNKIIGICNLEANQTVTIGTSGSGYVNFTVGIYTFDL